MINPDNKPVDTVIEQKRRGYATPRRVRELRIGSGNVVGGWSIDAAGSFLSDPDASNFRIRLDSENKRITFDGGASLKNTATPFSGAGGMAIEHDTGLVLIEVSGEGEGVGSQQVLLKNNDETVYFGIQTDVNGTTRIIASGLPTSNPGGSGVLWSDSGTLKIT